jgi:hypothetical protein
VLPRPPGLARQHVRRARRELHLRNLPFARHRPPEPHAARGPERDLAIFEPNIGASREQSSDGSSWEHDFDLRYTNASRLAVERPRDGPVAFASSAAFQPRNRSRIAGSKRDAVALDAEIRGPCCGSLADDVAR